MITARATLRLANADVLPFQFSPFVEHVKTYRDELIALLDESRIETDRHNALIASNAYILASDPSKTYVPPAVKDEVPFLNFAPIQNVIARLEESAKSYDSNYAAMIASHGSMSEATATMMSEYGDALRQLNELLIATERAMTRDDGLPRRPWFRHQIYAPGFYTGYGVKTLPGIREAIEEGAWDEASRQVERLAETIDGLADKIDEATAMLPGILITFLQPLSDQTRLLH